MCVNARKKHSLYWLFPLRTLRFVIIFVVVMLLFFFCTVLFLSIIHVDNTFSPIHIYVNSFNSTQRHNTSLHRYSFFSVLQWSSESGVNRIDLHKMLNHHIYTQEHRKSHTQVYKTLVDSGESIRYQ